MHRRLALVLALALGAAGCGGGGDGGSDAPAAPAKRTIQGAVSKGPLAGATVEVFALDGAGLAQGPVLATATTNGAGAFSVTLPAAVTEPVLVVASGGTYRDESDTGPPASRRRITLGAADTFEAVLPAGASTVALTPYSMSVLARARRLANGANFLTVYPAVLAQTSGVFGFDVTTLAPADPAAPDLGGSAQSVQYALLLGGAAQAINAIALELGRYPDYAVVRAFIDDFADGKVDGKVGGTAVRVATVPISTTVDLNAEIARFRNNNFAAYEGVTPASVDEAELSKPVNLGGNLAPLARADSFALAEGGSVGGNVLANDSDTEGGALSAALVSGPVRAASFALNANGTFSYVHNGSETVTDSFSYRASDGSLNSAAVAVTLTIGPVNDAPAAAGDAYGATEDVVLTVAAGAGVLVNDADADGDTLSAVLVSPLTQGTLALAADGSFSFTPATNFNGAASFSYKAGDGTTFSSPVTVTISVGAVNDAPAISTTAPATATEDTAYSYAAAAGDVDGPGATWSTDASHTCGGAIDSGTGLFSFTPAGPSPPASCIVAINVCDGGAPSLCASQVATVTIGPADDAPVAASITPAAFDEDTQSLITLSYADPEGDAATSCTVTGATNVTVTQACGCTAGVCSVGVTGTPLDYNGPAGFDYSVTAASLTSNTATATLSISAVNDAPAISTTAPATATEDTAYSYAAAAGDVDGPGATWSTDASHSCGGAIDSGTGLFSFTPAGPSPPASCVVAIKVCDGGAPSLCDTESATVTITAANDAPVISSTPPTTATEDAPYSYSATVDDADGPGATWSTDVGHTCGGSVNATTGVYGFTPNGPVPSASCVIKLKVCDGGAPSLCGAQSALVTITAVNDAPVITSTAPATAIEDTPYSYSATADDADGPGTTWALDAADTCGGSVSPTGVYDFTPAGPAPAASCVVAVKACDGSLCGTQSSTVTINAINDPPAISDFPGGSITEDSDTGSIDYTISDPDGDVNLATLGGSSSNLTLVPNTNFVFGGTGSLRDVTITPAADQHGVTTITITVTDADGATATDTFDLTVTPVNDAPTGSVVITGIAAENETLTADAAGVSDADGVGVLARQWYRDGVPINGATADTYALVNDDVGAMITADITYTDNDGTQETVGSNAVGPVTNVNDPPVLGTNLGLAVTEGVPQSIFTSELSASDIDSGDSNIVYAVTTAPANGFVEVNSLPASGFSQNDLAFGFVSYRHDGSETLSDSFQFTIENPGDPASVSGPYTFSISVTPQNDAPAITLPAPVTVNEDVPIPLAGVSVSDADGDLASVDLYVYSGMLSATVSGGATVSAGTNPGPFMTLSGTQTQINAALATLSYQGYAHFNGPDQLDLYAFDSWGAADSGTLPITVDPVNDAPVISSTLAEFVNEGSFFYLFIAADDSNDGALADDATELVFTLESAPANGQLLLDGVTPIGASETFTLDDTILGRVTYQHDGSETSSDSFDLSLHGSSGDYSSCSAATPCPFAVTVNPVNDPPVVTLPAPQSVDEDTSLAIVGVSVADGDGDLASVELHVYGGLIEVDTAGGATLAAGTNPGTTIGLAGTDAQLNAALATLTYQGFEHVSGSDQLDVYALDAASASGFGTLPITVLPVNDAPVISSALAETVNEDGTFFLYIAADDSNDGVLADDNTELVFTLENVPASGQILLDGITPIGASDTFTLDDLVFGRVTYRHDGSETLSDSFDLSLHGSSGDYSSCSQATPCPFAITVNPVNDAPVLTVPGPQAVNEDTGLAITGLSVADAEDNVTTLSLSVGAGNITVALSGTTVSSGANASAFMELTGTQAQLNAALASLAYQGTGDFYGSDALNLSVFDSDFSGDFESVDITVDPVDDAPVVTSLSGFAETAFEGSSFTLGWFHLNADDGADGVLADAPADLVYDVLTVPANGELRLLGVATTTFTQEDINSGFVEYHHDGSETTSDGFTFKLHGSSVPLESNCSTASPCTFTITVTPQNDAPVNVLPLAQTVSEDTALPISGISVSDAEDDLGRVDLYVNYGTLTVDPSGATFDDGGNGTNYMVLTGTQAELNAALATLVYQGYADFNGGDQLLLSVYDSVFASDSDLLDISVTAVNDAPAVTGSLAETVSEGATFTFYAGLLSADDAADGVDADADADLIFNVETAPAYGQILLNGVTPVSQFSQEDLWSGFVSYEHSGSEIAADSFTFSVHGAIGDESPDCPSATPCTFDITVNGVNSAPSVTLSIISPISVPMNNGFIISALDVADPDAGANAVNLTLSLSRTDAGTLTVDAGFAGSVDDSIPGTVTLTGSVAQINSHFDSGLSRGVTFTPDSGAPYSGSVTLSATIDDLGNTGSGFALQHSAAPVTFQFDRFELSTVDSFGLTLNGAVANDQSGSSVSSAGDINGDGLDDLLVGAKNANGGTGAAYVVFGNASHAGAVELSALNGADGFAILGESAGDQAGFNVSGAGDLNGDGYGDVLIGAPNADVGPNANAGKVYILFGSDSVGQTGSVYLPSGGVVRVLEGVAAGDQTGTMVRGAGDVNGDGFADLIVGARVAFGSAASSGKAYVVFGKTALKPSFGCDGPCPPINLAALDGSDGFSLDGEVAGDLAGASVSGAGDINGDGFDDLLVGAPQVGTGNGKAYLVYGDVSVGSSGAIALGSLNGTDGVVFNGISFDDEAGRGVGGAGDFNADGYDDLVIGANMRDPGGASAAGQSYLVYGASPLGLAGVFDLSAADVILNGAAANDHSGGHVGGVGDVNADGYGDVLIGATNVDPAGRTTAGASYLVFGGSGVPSLVALALLDGTDGFVLNGAAVGDNSAVDLRGAGDFNGDGFADLTIGAFFADPNGAESGRSYLVFGADFRRQGTTPNLRPQAADDSINVDEGGVATLLVSTDDSVIDNDSDPDGTTPSAVLRTAPKRGTLVLDADGTFTYTHNGSEVLTDSFTYQATDGQSFSNVATVVITINLVNDNPVAVDDSYNVLSDTTGNVFTVLGNDSDQETPLTLTSTTPPSAGGMVTIDSGTQLLYDPANGFSGTETFDYTVSDGNGGTDTATVTVTVLQPLADADSDGLTNSDEINITGTDPLDADSDNDGFGDGDEVAASTDPFDADTDDDGLEDGEEANTHLTDPLDSDSDNDGFSDGAEVTAGTDPLDADSVPLTFTASHVAVGTDTYVRSVIADFDLDGKPDLAMTRSGTPGAVDVFYGVGDGSFGAANSYTIGNNPYGLAVGDFNRDGKQDLIASNANDDTLQVLTNNGAGFTVGAAIAACDIPKGIAVLDINRDGNEDVATGCFGSADNVRYLLGDGVGGLAGGGSTGAIFNARNLAAGDLNADGYDDLVVTMNDGSSNASVALGNGIAFAAPALVNLSGNGFWDDIALADFDRDGILDIALTDSNANPRVEVLFGNGSGGFGSGAPYTLSDTQGLVAADFDGDGAIDLAVADGNSHVRVLRNRGNGGFVSGGAVSTGLSPGPMYPAVGDLDGDGRPDLAVPHGFDPSFSVLRNSEPWTSAGSFGTATNLASGAEPHSVVTGDFNRDGRLDYVTADSGSGADTLSIRTGLGTGAFNAATTIAVGTQPYSVAVTDFNLDGKLDFASANLAGNSVTVWMGDGAGSVTGGPTTLSLGAGPYFVATGDFDQDGLPDIATANGSGTVSIVLQTAPGVFGGVGNIAAGVLSVAIAIGDINRDGDLDLAVANSTSDNVSILMGSTNGTFVGAVNISAGDGPAAVALADLNRDGKLDLVVGNYNASNVGVLLGNGDSTFGGMSTFSAGSNPAGIAIADYNRDGKLDVATANNGNAAVLAGDGLGGLAGPATYTVGFNPRALAAGDFNGDGRPDLAVANWGPSSSNVSILLNQ